MSPKCLVIVVALVNLAAVQATGCGGDDDGPAVRDAGTAPDSGGGGMDAGDGVDAGPGMDAGAGTDAGGGMDAGPETDAGVGTDARPAVDTGMTGPDAGPGVDAGMCLSGTSGTVCAGGTTCECCPAGGPSEHCLCTTRCSTDADCTDPVRPDCNRASGGAGGSMTGICAPAGFVCRWGSICASPDTRIATPDGERPIASLMSGDLVYSVRAGRVVTVPIREVSSTRVWAHTVVQVRLETGATLEISAGHPTADGRIFGDLRPGDPLDGARVLGVATVPYAHERTHDILPDSDTGTYFAGGALIGSTLAGP